MNDNQADKLFSMPDNICTRWASPENFTSKKGNAGKAAGGRKGSAHFPLKAGESKIRIALKKNNKK